MVHPTFVPPDERYPWLTDLDKAPARLVSLEEAQKTLQSVRIAPDFFPAFPLIIQPRELELIQEIRAQLEMLHTYLTSRKMRNRLLEMKQRGESSRKLVQELEALHKVPPPEEYLWSPMWKFETSGKKPNRPP